MAADLAGLKVLSLISDGSGRWPQLCHGSGKFPNINGREARVPHGL